MYVSYKNGPYKIYSQCTVLYPLLHYIQTLTFTIAGQNLTARLRGLSFKAMLRQEISWFDDEKNSTGALTTRLAHDAAQVQGVSLTHCVCVYSTLASIVAPYSDRASNPVADHSVKIQLNFRIFAHNSG